MLFVGVAGEDGCSGLRCCFFQGYFFFFDGIILGWSLNLTESKFFIIIVVSIKFSPLR